jgi:hypothetical protein
LDYFIIIRHRLVCLDFHPTFFSHPPSNRNRNRNAIVFSTLIHFWRDLSLLPCNRISIKFASAHMPYFKSSFSGYFSHFSLRLRWMQMIQLFFFSSFFLKISNLENGGESEKEKVFQCSKFIIR